MEKYFQHQFWKIRHAQNIYKIVPNEKTDQSHLLIFLRMPNHSKFMPNKVIIPFYSIFVPIKLKKGLIFYVSKQDIFYDFNRVIYFFHYKERVC